MGITPKLWKNYQESSKVGETKRQLGGCSGSCVYRGQCVSTSGEAIIVAQDVVKTMLAEGYVLGKDALIKAKAFDEYHGVSATTTAKIAELSNRIGLTDKIHVGMETIKSVDKKFHVSEITKSAATITGTAAVVVAMVTGKAAVAASHAVVNSTYFAKGVLWVSDTLNRAAKAVADFGRHGTDGSKQID
ncbi:binding partner of ACD11 1-like [Quercus robur]|uniref:binding partner of ACD11 1-like n=1 Tax=Quercus robur TaxID=38942 RepID=UPI0021615AEB|nr:binding partner of ACD11 1-like [Quercus robur]XP_050251458.1 binding partner of ACD11 1-like [Quercus robur]